MHGCLHPSNDQGACAVLSLVCVWSDLMLCFPCGSLLGCKGHLTPISRSTFATTQPSLVSATVRSFVKKTCSRTCSWFQFPILVDGVTQTGSPPPPPPSSPHQALHHAYWPSPEKASLFNLLQNGAFAFATKGILAWFLYIHPPTPIVKVGGMSASYTCCHTCFDS